MWEESTGGHTSPLYARAGKFWALLYLVVALWVKAVVMFSVLVRAVYVSTVLTAREPANRRGRENKPLSWQQCL